LRHVERHGCGQLADVRASFGLDGACLLLGGCPLLLDQLQQRLAAIPQALAFLDRVEHRYRRMRQSEEHLLITCCGDAATVGLDVLGASAAWFRRHRRLGFCFTRKMVSGGKIRLSQFLVPESASNVVLQCESENLTFIRIKASNIPIKQH
jgi:hypothetical protein